MPYACDHPRLYSQTSDDTQTGGECFQVETENCPDCGLIYIVSIVQIAKGRPAAETGRETVGS